MTLQTMPFRRRWATVVVNKTSTVANRRGIIVLVNHAYSATVGNRRGKQPSTVENRRRRIVE